MKLRSSYQPLLKRPLQNGLTQPPLQGIGPGEPVPQRLRAVEMEDPPRAVVGVAQVGEPGFDPGALVAERQWQFHVRDVCRETC